MFSGLCLPLGVGSAALLSLASDDTSLQAHLLPRMQLTLKEFKSRLGFKVTGSYSVKAKLQKARGILLLPPWLCKASGNMRRELRKVRVSPSQTQTGLQIGDNRYKFS